MNALTRRDPTLADFNFAGQLGLYCTVPGTILCFLVLVFYGLIALYRQGRKHLDRVSFRLLAYSLFFNVLYGIAFAVTAAQDGPGSLCTFGAFAVNFTLSFAIFFTTCIAINLQLVLVHHVNGKKMEKCYIIVTTILSIVLTVPAYGLGQFGYHAPSSTCWFKNPDPKERLHWLIGTQSFWMALAALIETTCSSVVLFWMFSFQMNTRYLQKASTPGHTRSLATNSGTMSGTTSGAKTSFWSGTSSSHTAVRDVSSKYRGVIIRIALYPIISLLINAPTVALDIYSVVVPLTTDLDYRLLVVDLVLYGLRTLLYAILAFGDPSFIKAVREIKGKQKRSTNDSGKSVSNPMFAIGGRGGRSQADSAVTTMGGGPLAVNVELQQVTQSDDMSMGTKTVKGGAQDHESMFGLNQKQTTGSVDYNSGFLSSRTEAQTRSRFEIEQEWEEERKFEQQL